MPEELDYDIFMNWAREEFENAYKVLSPTSIWPFKTPFPADYHFVGDDHEFTEKVNKAIPIFGKRIHEEGIRIPDGEISVISYVRKSKAYQAEVDNDGGVWTFDRVMEIPKDHPLIAGFKTSIDPFDKGSAAAINEVRQWFAIGRFQATIDNRPPVFLFLYGFCDFDVENAVMGGVFGLTRWAEIIFELDGAPPEKIKEVEHALNYECCEALRQVAAILYLKER